LWNFHKPGDGRPSAVEAAHCLIKAFVSNEFSSRSVSRVDEIDGPTKKPPEGGLVMTGRTDQGLSILMPKKLVLSAIGFP
jgi:hypothetical protein